LRGLLALGDVGPSLGKSKNQVQLEWDLKMAQKGDKITTKTEAPTTTTNDETRREEKKEV
jgi:hypothetical protein